jgi:hypothetical protein
MTWLCLVHQAAARADQLAIDLQQEKTQVGALRKLIEDQKTAAIERAHVCFHSDSNFSFRHFYNFH